MTARAIAKSLPLPPGEVHAGLRDPHLQPVGVGADEIVCGGHP